MPPTCATACFLDHAQRRLAAPAGSMPPRVETLETPSWVGWAAIGIIPSGERGTTHERDVKPGDHGTSRHNEDYGRIVSCQWVHDIA